MCGLLYYQPAKNAVAPGRGRRVLILYLIKIGGGSDIITMQVFFPPT